MGACCFSSIVPSIGFSNSLLERELLQATPVGVSQLQQFGQTCQLSGHCQAPEASWDELVNRRLSFPDGIERGGSQWGSRTWVRNRVIPFQFVAKAA